MFQSIRSRLVGTYFLLALLTVALVETLFLVGVRQYYLANIREILEQQAKLAGSFYEQYLGQEQIERSASALLDGFAGITAARMQVITPEGTVLADSLGDLSPLVMPDDHWRRAVAGEVTAWQGKLEKEPVLVVSAPLKTSGAVVGVVRYMTSLEPLEEMIRGLLFRLLLAGTAIVLLAALGLVVSLGGNSFFHSVLYLVGPAYGLFNNTTMWDDARRFRRLLREAERTAVQASSVRPPSCEGNLSSVWHRCKSLDITPLPP
ncbi:MAG: cell wall metabolism sensor histidine kinase WalK [Dehalococcoidia bacterium]|nr:cell wall metabolism sensor histidine kinase WalK [Dehalococcoidia bacterium]